MLNRRSTVKALNPSYLFPEIEKRKREFLEENPGVELISLGVGDTLLPLPKIIADALSEASTELGTKEGYTGYGSGQGIYELRERIQKHLYPHLSPDDIFISDGAKSELGRLQNLLGKDLVVGVQDPAYPVYVEGSILQGVEKIIPLPCTAQNGFVPEIPSGIDLLYLCNPNNPTGKAFTYDELALIVRKAQEEGFLIIYDGAYTAYIQDPSLPKSIYDIPGATHVAIEVNSFSKMAGFTGIRLGWTVVPREIKYACGHCFQKDYIRFASTLFNGASNIAQKGGFAVFSEEGLRAIQDPIRKTMENAGFLKSAFEKEGYKVYGGVHAPYLWIHTPGKLSWNLFQEFLEMRHLIVTPGRGYGEGGEYFFRVSAFGYPDKIKVLANKMVGKVKLPEV